MDEALRESKLEVPMRLMVQFATIIARRALSKFRVMISAALNFGSGRAALIDFVIPLIAFIGCPARSMGLGPSEATARS